MRREAFEQAMFHGGALVFEEQLNKQANISCEWHRRKSTRRKDRQEVMPSNISYTDPDMDVTRRLHQCGTDANAIRAATLFRDRF